MPEMLHKSVIVLAMLGAAALVTSTTESLAQTVPPDLPQAIMCWNNRTETWVVGYLATVKKDGTATYMPPGGQLSATVNAKRIVEPPSGRTAAVDCYGKSVDELRSMGRIIESQRSR
ncbi:hypothetical protein [Microvirga sp. P5_D2]